jgi:hypothetical protein
VSARSTAAAAGGAAGQGWLLLLLCGLLLGSPPAAGQEARRGMAFDVYIRLEHGMTEGELVLRAGRPDHQSIDSPREGGKRLHYYPTPANPFLTTITLRAGRIVNIERLRRNP